MEQRNVHNKVTKNECFEVSQRGCHKEDDLQGKDVTVKDCTTNSMKAVKREVHKNMPK